ncbi:MAG: hypothetical protein HZB16_18350 [Armatimonadetes bacterium]|nr:hypothetical protein [Armatimonadota bacterium]
MADEANWQPDPTGLRVALGGFEQATAWIRPRRHGVLDLDLLRQWARLIGGTTALCVMGIMLADAEHGGLPVRTALLPLGLGVLLLGLYHFHLGIDPSSLSARWSAEADEQGLTLHRGSDNWRVPWARIEHVEPGGDDAAFVHCGEGEPVRIPSHAAFAPLVAAATWAAEQRRSR